MPELIADVERIIVDGDLAAVGSFNTNQHDHEIAKREFLTAHPDLEHPLLRLEDHPHLRGCLLAFELDPANFERRAHAFRAVFDDTEATDELRPTLLAIGSYHRRFGPYKLRLGSPRQTAQWHETHGRRRAIAGETYRHPLHTRNPSRHRRRVLNAARDRVQQIRDEWLDRQEAKQQFGWRYYLAKYPAMRVGTSGVYAAPDGDPSFSLCMLEGTSMNGCSRDPFLHAVAIAADATDEVTGSVEQARRRLVRRLVEAPRWMRLYGSGVQIRCVLEGFAVTAPTNGVHVPTFDQLVAAHGLLQTDDGYLLQAPQISIDGELVDTTDRVQQGAALLRDLLDAEP